MTTFRSTTKRHLKLIQQLQQYMTYKELPYSLQRRLLSYYNYRNKKGFERDKIIINHVSPYLREVQLLKRESSKLFHTYFLRGAKYYNQNTSKLYSLQASFIVRSQISLKPLKKMVAKTFRFRCYVSNNAIK